MDDKTHIDALRQIAKHKERFPPSVSRFAGELVEALEMLKSLEWSDDLSLSGDDEHCPACGRFQSAGHAPDCKFYRLLVAHGMGVKGMTPVVLVDDMAALDSVSPCRWV
jgi:hypothetical protein